MPEQCRMSAHTQRMYSRGLLESEKSYQSRAAGGPVQLGRSKYLSN